MAVSVHIERIDAVLKKYSEAQSNTWNAAIRKRVDELLDERIRFMTAPPTQNIFSQWGNKR